MENCIARQPIFNKKLNLYGYEILYRGNAASTSYSASDGDAATSETITKLFHELDVQQVTGGKRAFINFTKKILLDDIATILPSRILVVELLEDILPTPEVLSACRRLHSKGYTIALDDFNITPEYLPLLAVADIVKVDFLITPMEKIKSLCDNIRNKPILLLAEKIETNEEFNTARELGFSLFQGYFFSRPTLVQSEKTLSPLKANCLQLIHLANDANVEFSKMANIIMQDVALSYRLLRVVNSAFFGLRYTVRSIRQAIAILGLDEVRKWITLISLAHIKEGKPDELIRMSLVRAKFMERMGVAANMARDTDDLFMTGLLSLIDAITDMSMEEVIKQTRMSDTISQALLTGAGAAGGLLGIAADYEKSCWDEAFAAGEAYGLTQKDIADAYMEALQWSGKF